MNSETTSISEAQVAAENQSDSAKTPLALKSFTYNKVEVDILAFIRKKKPKPAKIERICNMEPNETLTLFIDSSYTVLRRIS